MEVHSTTRPTPDGLALLDALPIGVVVFDARGAIVHANREFAQMVGAGEAGLVDRKVEAFLPALRSQSSASRTLRARRLDGRELPVDVQTRAVVLDGQAAVMASVVPHAAAAHAGSAFRDVFANAPYGLLLVTPNGIITQANARLNAMFGYREGELEGEAIETLVPHRVRMGHGALVRGYANEPSPRAMGSGRDLTGRKKEGVEFPVEIGLCEVTTEFGRMLCASVIDITERKRSEHRLREANAQLEEFAYVAAHDLRSPIRGIANLIGFLIEDIGESASAGVKRNFQRIGDRVVAMERMIDDLLSYARSGQRTTKFEPIDLRAIVAELRLADPGPNGLVVEVEIASQPFEGARTPLVTAMRNLYSNAIKHHDRERMSIAIRSRDEGDYVVIDVTDDGPGIPESAQERIFKLFQTLSKSEKKGTGLGLAVAQRLVSGHGGRLGVISADGQRGSTFRIWWQRMKRSDLND